MNWRKLLVSCLVLILSLVGGTWMAFSKPLPDGEAGPTADAVAHEMEAAIHKDAWDQTGAVTWTFGGRHRHLWDRKRELSQVIWGDGKKEVKVQLRLDAPSLGLAWKGGHPVEGKKLKKLLEKGYAAWINDSFWLNPVAKVFDSGTVRKLLPLQDGKRRLMIQYISGGLTPGDSYLYTLGPDNLPEKWEMWVSIIPIGGVPTSFEGWITLETGAKVSTLHDLKAMKLQLTDVHGAASVEALSGSDVFAPLLAAHPRP